MEKLIQTGAFIKQECTVISPTFTIPKKDGTLRLIHDLRQINRELVAPHFTLNGAREAANVVRTSKVLVTLDLCKGYQQVVMAKEARPFLGAIWKQSTIASTVLPFGLSISPYVFTRLTSWLARVIRNKIGLNVAVYVDDFMLGAESNEVLMSGLVRVRELFQRLGVVLSPKTEQVPREEVEFLGLVWNSKEKTVSISTERRREYRKRIKNLLRGPQLKKTWEQAIGKLLFLREVVGQTLRRVRSFMRLIKGQKRDRLISAEGESREDLMWWLEALTRPVSFKLTETPVSATIVTDASREWLGGVLELWDSNNAKSYKGYPWAANQEGEKGKKYLQTRVTEPGDHINVKELEALYRGLKSNKEILKDRRIIWFTDNIAA